jgi:hypothetical protein
MSEVGDQTSEVSSPLRGGSRSLVQGNTRGFQPFKLFNRYAPFKPIEPEVRSDLRGQRDPNHTFPPFNRYRSLLPWGSTFKRSGSNVSIAVSRFIGQ